MSLAPGRLAGAFVGAIAGVLSGMLGIGGGLVVTPVLVMRGIPLRRATGTALGVVLSCGLVAVFAEFLTAPEQLVVGAAIEIALMAQLGVWLGRRILPKVPDPLLRSAFLALLLLAAARSLGLFSGWESMEDSTAIAVASADAGLAATHLPQLAAGLLAGICAVLFGVGGGVVVVPMLTYMTETFSFAEAAAVSLLAMIPTALSGLWVARRDGRVESGLLKTLLPTAAIGAVVGVWLRNRAVDAAVLEVLFGLFLLYAALRLWQGRPRRST